MTPAVTGPTDDTADAIDSVVAGRYRSKQLGRGGMGCVYRARDLASGERVALKRLERGAEANPALSALFEREFHTLRS